MTFSAEETARYSRHLSLEGFGPAAQEKLRSATVLVVGAGGLGCPALLYLAAAGVGRIVLVDDDRVDVSNLQRQVLYAAEDAGLPKAGAAARRLRALNPLVAVEARAVRFDRRNALEFVRDADVVIDGSDNFATRYLVNDACVLAGKPYVYGAVQGFAGQLSVFNWRDGPTYRCLFPEPPPAGSVPNCAEAGVLGVLPGLIGTGQATEAIKLITGLGTPLSGRLWLWDALTMAVQTVTLAADPRSREICELPPDGYGATCDVAARAADEISVAEFRAGLAVGSRWQVLDVRENWERSQGAILPSVHVPLAEIERGGFGDGTLAEFDPALKTVVYCAAGARSLRAARVLRERDGFSDVVSLRGGFKAWQQTADS